MRRRRRATASPGDGWTSEVSSGLALAGFLFLVFVGVHAAGDRAADLDRHLLQPDPPPPCWVPFLHVLDRIGQRAVCLPILGRSSLRVAPHRESWRPAVVVARSVFLLNLVVRILKVVLGRERRTPPTRRSSSAGWPTRRGTPPTSCWSTAWRRTC